MRLKLLFIVGLGVGYVLGARAGRPRYEQIKAKATDAWEDPRVQKIVTETQDFFKDAAPVVQEKVVQGAKAAVAGAQDVAAQAAELASDVADTVATTSRKASRKAKETSKKVAKAAQDASAAVSKTARNVKDRVVDRGEDVVNGVITAAGTARDGALDVDDSDDNQA
ncbi:ElaB/YqjD/DUF883 family membrane-anchored ribosome-binding protein [Cryobacterium mesophilum]|uniref:Protoporphyrinogen oxidase n=1 Tax=Terrimesophilobacter mesophilus TaxID=433647 RepID=A0A4R8V7R7_9MICO|nr:hypothetical protein [Terrimesophilobacter mesophilus]MBB5634109.1 ElaB/YqjD/DUF883 family membrane-anchored ribosome-binding protein [Terrimesophilobacter mesophilus]TFB78693.1 hypothetical protein E3N84_00510 [Terrimesophilobacter mesophilus]